ncbi:hypothetical protein A8W25_11490 [Streptomyces sp. ERV7]|nr:hypothetical protein [Streptomyces sp. ERV7]OAR26091.1 hypothetical protein A8W25_11490 [Streptomyces sp. ERV7]
MGAHRRHGAVEDLADPEGAERDDAGLGGGRGAPAGVPVAARSGRRAPAALLGARTAPAPPAPETDPYATAPYAEVPQQQSYGQWDTAAYTNAEYPQQQYDPYQQQYQQYDPYQQQQYPPQEPAYDPYGYGYGGEQAPGQGQGEGGRIPGQSADGQGHDTEQPHRPDGSNQ